MILGVLQQKGGAGKTTLSINLAAHFAKQGSRTLLVDADPQASALAWADVRTLDPLFPVVGMPKPTLHKDLPGLANGYDLVVIDGAPRTNELARSAISACDFILIPVQPSPFDIWSCADIVRLIADAPRRIPAAFVINRRIPGTAIGRDVVNAITHHQLPVLRHAVSQRIAFAESAAVGLSVLELAGAGQAAKDIAAIAKEIHTLSTERKAA